jgi:uncharacterized protein
MNLESKVRCLLETLKKMGACAVAFSGGVDSSVLLAAASKILKQSVLAITVKPPYFPDTELGEASDFTAGLKVRHRVIDMEIPEEIKKNPRDRCYLCKRQLFLRMTGEAREQGIIEVIDGSNAEDMNEHRPGMKALEELGIRSPLKECGFTKSEIRTLAKQWNLSTAEKPSYSCLLTRIPHGKRIRNKVLRRIEQAETCIKGLGFPQVRVRNHGKCARIEIGEDKFKEFLNPGLLRKVDKELKLLGYRHVCLDCRGYRRGSMEPSSSVQREEGTTDG